MSSHCWKRVRAVAAGVVSAGLVAILGVTALPSDTAQAAGIVVERHQLFGSVASGLRERDEDA